MDDEPPLPEEIPAIPRGELLTSLLFPPGLIALLTFVFISLEAGNDSEWLVLFVIPIVVLVSLVHFLTAVQVRYRGRSFVLLGFGFFIGETVICLAAWFATVLICTWPLH